MHSILSLQPDHRGVINVSEQTLCAAEYMHLMQDGGPCTKNKLMTANYGGRGRAGLTVEPIEPDATEDALFAPRTGPVVLPFMRHLLGVGNHAFCGDTRITVAVADGAEADGLAPHDTCTLTAWQQDQGIPKVGVFDADGKVHGVIVGVVEDSYRRAYRGITSDMTSIGSRNMFIVQLMGVAKIHSSGLAGAAFNTEVYGATGFATVAASGGKFMGYYLGKALANDPDDRDNETSYIMLPGGGGQNTPFHFEVFITDAVAAKVGIRCGLWYRKGTVAQSQSSTDPSGYSVDVAEHYEMDLSSATPDQQYIVYATLDFNGSNNKEVVPKAQGLKYEWAALWYGSDNWRTINKWPIFAFKIVALEGGGYSISELDQLWHGGNIVDDGVLCDGDHTSVAGTIRHTLEMRYDAWEDPQRLTIQMYNVDTCAPSTNSIPVFTSDASSPAGGTLMWAFVDGENWGVGAHPACSLDVIGTTGPTAYLQIHGFLAGEPVFTPTVKTQLNGVLTRVEASAGPPPTYELKYMDFGALIPDPFDEDTIWNQLCDKIIELQCTVPSDPMYHKDLYFDPDSEGAAGQNKDHDARYWIKGEDYTKNYGQSIGKTSLVKVIDLTNCQLTSESDVYVEWVEQKLWTPGQLTADVDWGAHLLNDSWTVGKLIVSSTDPATADDTGCVQMAGGFSAKESCYISDKLKCVNGDAEAHLADATATRAGYFKYDKLQAWLCDNAAPRAGYFEYDGSIKATLATNGFAGGFVDPSHSAYLADGSNAAYLSGGNHEIYIGSTVSGYTGLLVTWGGGYPSAAHVRAGNIGGGVALRVYGGNIDCGNSYCQNGTVGMDETSGDWALVNQTSGAFKQVYIRGGIVCAS